MFNLTRLTYDQFTFKIRQEKRRCLAWNLVMPFTTTTEKDIVLNTRTNPVMIASAGTAFAAATEENVSRMSREILFLQNRLQDSEQREARLEQEKRALREEIQQLQDKNTLINEVPLTVQRELVTLEATMKQVYGDTFTIKQTVAPLLRAQVETKKRNEKLKESSAALDRMIEWTKGYLQAPKTVPRKDWIHTQNDKV